MGLTWPWIALGKIGGGREVAGSACKLGEDSRFQDKRATVADEIGIGSNSCGEADSGCQFVRGERFNE